MHMKYSLTKFESLPGTKKVFPVQSKKDFSSLLPGKKSACRIIGIDPGLANTGFGIVDFFDDRYRLVSYGCISTKPEEILGVRLLKISSRLQAVIDEFKPEFASMEELFFARNVSSAISVAEAKGVATLVLAQNCIELTEYKPNQIKKSVTGTAAADKNLVKMYVKILLGLEKEPEPDHAADALACAVTHLHYRMSGINC